MVQCLFGDGVEAVLSMAWGPAAEIASRRRVDSAGPAELAVAAPVGDGWGLLERSEHAVAATGEIACSRPEI